jgi:hypothetical protein
MLGYGNKRLTQATSDFTAFENVLPGKQTPDFTCVINTVTINP